MAFKRQRQVSWQWHQPPLSTLICVLCDPMDLNMFGWLKCSLTTSSLAEVNAAFSQSASRIRELGGQRTDLLSERCRVEMEYCFQLQPPHIHIFHFIKLIQIISSEIFGIEWCLSKLPWRLMGGVVWRFPLFLRLVSSSVCPFRWGTVVSLIVELSQWFMCHFFLNRKFYCLKNENAFWFSLSKKTEKIMQKGHNFFKQLSFIKNQTNKSRPAFTGGISTVPYVQAQGFSLMLDLPLWKWRSATESLFLINQWDTKDHRNSCNWQGDALAWAKGWSTEERPQTWISYMNNERQLRGRYRQDASCTVMQILL